MDNNTATLSEGRVYTLEQIYRVQQESGFDPSVKYSVEEITNMQREFKPCLVLKVADTFYIVDLQYFTVEDIHGFPRLSNSKWEFHPEAHPRIPTYVCIESEKDQLIWFTLVRMNERWSRVIAVPRWKPTPQGFHSIQQTQPH